jgi:hypothetical protein
LANLHELVEHAVDAGAAESDHYNLKSVLCEICQSRNERVLLSDLFFTQLSISGFFKISNASGEVKPLCHTISELIQTPELYKDSDDFILEACYYKGENHIFNNRRLY